MSIRAVRAICVFISYDEHLHNTPMNMNLNDSQRALQYTARRQVFEHVACASLQFHIFTHWMCEQELARVMVLLGARRGGAYSARCVCRLEYEHLISDHPSW